MFLFVGERPSRRAVAIRATWRNGRLAGKQLHDALKAAGLDPAAFVYTNLYGSNADGPYAVTPHARRTVRRAVRNGLVVVGMGKRVQADLTLLGVPHRPLVHPAARGAIRGKSLYCQHVASVLTPEPT